MNILQINKYHYIKGGSDRVYFNTSNLLGSYGHQIFSFSTLDINNAPNLFSEYFVPAVDNRKAGILQKALNTRNYLYDKDASRNLERLIEKYKPDVAHLHLFYGGLSASILRTLKKKGVPVIHTVHDYRLLCPAYTFLDSANSICEKCKNRSYYQCAVNRCMDDNFFYSSMLSLEAYIRKYFIDPIEYIDHFIFVSKFALEKHIQFDRRYSGKSSHLYNFTDFKSGNQRTSGKKYFLYYGRLAKEKGLSTLLNAAATLNIELIIAGTGPLEDQVREYANKNKSIHFVGYKSGEELTNLIRNAYFVIVPSEWYENNPMTVIESYALGKPVIGARIGGIPEIVTENKTGFLFDSRNIDDLIRTIKNANSIDLPEYQEMSSNARLFASENFSPESHYLRLKEIYTGVIL